MDLFPEKARDLVTGEKVQEWGIECFHCLSLYWQDQPPGIL